jgi:antitoxin component of MazEF toxin-antitoxin module
MAPPMRRKLVRMGNSLGVTLSPAAIASLGVAEGDPVDVDVEDGRVVITGKRQLAALLAEWRPIAEEIDPSALDDLTREDREAG